MSSSNRKPWLVAALALTALSLTVAALLQRRAEVTTPPPDVVIIALDTLRPDHLGCYGYERETSPTIDAFAETAIVFEQAESVSPWTAPALISLMTSLHPEVHGVYVFPEPGSLNEGVDTLAERLKASGYATGAFTEGGYAKPEFGLGQGFDTFPANAGDEHSHDSNMSHASRLASNLDRALAWYAEHADKPRFLFFHTYEVHEPFFAPDEHVRKFRPDWDSEAEDARVADLFERFAAARAAWGPAPGFQFDISPDEVQLVFNHNHHCISPVGLAVPEGFQVFLSQNGLNPEDGSLNVDKLQFFRDQYDAEISYTDAQLGRLFEAIDDEAVVVIVSDHGEAIGEHGIIGHGSKFHGEQIGVVLIVRGPKGAGIAPGRATELVRSIDVQPTILELANLPLTDLPIQGQSLVPLMRGEAFEPRPSVSHGLSQGTAELSRRSMRKGSYRVIQDALTRELELYDLSTDPNELVNIAASNPDRVRELGGLLEALTGVDQDLRNQVGSTGKVELTDDMLARLKELGYIGEEDQ